MDVALAEARRTGTWLAVLLIDLDHFKLVNDMHGHQAGDRMLAEVAPRLLGAVRDGDVVGRMGGDEFAVVCRGLVSQVARDRLLERMGEMWKRPVAVNGIEVPLSGSMGVAHAQHGNGTAQSLLRDADVALYRAKAVQRGSVVVFDESLRAGLAREAALDRGLRGAIERDELTLAYQAVVDLPTGAVVGAEILMRWTSAELGVVRPDEFIPLAEDRGLIATLGEWALEECCRVLAGWRERGVVADDFHLALNVSGRQLLPGFAAQVVAALERHGLPVHALCLEITESVLLDDSTSTSTALAELDALGIEMLLDDFGTGFSSLSYLQRFPLAGLKIDKSFVGAIPTSSRQRALVRAMLTMSKALGMGVVAEGVETLEVADTLRRLGCDRAQGYLWARPVSAEVFEATSVQPDLPLPRRGVTASRVLPACRRRSDPSAGHGRAPPTRSRVAPEPARHDHGEPSEPGRYRSTSASGSSRTCSTHHGLTSRAPASTSRRNDTHGTHTKSSTSSGFGTTASAVRARNTGQISFSTVPSGITAR